MHEHLFRHQNALEAEDLQRYAVTLGLDPDRFARDCASADLHARIDRDMTSGERSGVQGTPTFFIIGRRHDGKYDVDTLRTAIAEALDCHE